MATYRKRRRSRNYKRRKYTRRLRNIRRSKRFIQKAGVLFRNSSKVQSYTERSDAEIDQNIESARKQRIDALFQTTQDIKKKYSSSLATKLEEQDLERLTRTFQKFFDHFIGTAKMANVTTNRGYIIPIKVRIAALNTKTTITELIELCNTIEENIRLAYHIDSETT